MKGIISGIKRMESHDGDGLRTTVFFKGCPLKCIWCHNPESISFKKQVAFYRDKCIQCGICKGEHNDITAQSCPADALIPYGAEYEVNSSKFVKGTAELLVTEYLTLLNQLHKTRK